MARITNPRQRGNFSSKDIEGQRNQYTIVAGSEKVVKYEYTKGQKTPEGISTTSHHIGIGYGLAYNPYINVPFSASWSIGQTNIKYLGNIYSNKRTK